jgi:hypothetical protein
MTADDRELRGNRIGLDGRFLLAPRLSVSGSAAAWDLGISGGPAVDASVASVWRATQRWNLGAGFEQTSVFENLETVVSRLHGTGPFASLAFESPMTTFSFRASAQELSDDNGQAAGDADLDARALVAPQSRSSDRMGRIAPLSDVIAGVLLAVAPDQSGRPACSTPTSSPSLASRTIGSRRSRSAISWASTTTARPITIR